MRRIAIITVVLLAASAVVVLGTGASDGGSGYQVRAIFDNAVSVIPGEDLKIAGVKVGKVTGLDVTADQKAAITVRVDKPGFAPWRKDATCTIRPQSLIGEKFVECTPTQPRAVGAQEPPPLNKITSGPGKGQHLLPVTNTSTPVDVDLIGNVLRKPFQQRLTLIINELGTGLAGRGSDLNQVIKRANPALLELDKVLQILRRQRRTLARLAVDSDTVLAPLSREREHVANFIVKANETAKATVEKRAALSLDIQKLPTFLRELTPTMVKLGGLADQMTPVLTDLHSVAPDVNRTIEQLGPFSTAGLPALKALGSASQVGSVALPKTKGIITDLGTFATTARPLTSNLKALTQSLKSSGALERALDYGFYQAAAVNGYDSISHYLRAGLLVNLCSTYAITFDSSNGCSARFNNSSPTSASTSTRTPVDPVISPNIVRLNQLFQGGANTGTGTGNATSTSPKSTKRTTTRGRALRLPSSILPFNSGDTTGGGTTTTPTPAPTTTTTTPSDARPPTSTSPSSDPSSGLFDYLFGGDSG